MLWLRIFTRDRQLNFQNFQKTCVEYNDSNRCSHILNINLRRYRLDFIQTHINHATL